MIKILITIALILLTTACAPYAGLTSYNNPQWERVKQAQPIEETSHTATHDNIVYANKRCNANEFGEDKETWGISDYWATPDELKAKGQGDCEDYAICKYYELRKRGFNSRDLQIVIGKIGAAKTPHAILMVKFNNKHYVLDNRHANIIEYKDYFDFEPVYKLNEEK